MSQEASQERRQVSEPVLLCEAAMSERKVYFYVVDRPHGQEVWGCWVNEWGEPCEDSELPPETLEGVKILRVEEVDGRLVFYAEEQ